MRGPQKYYKIGVLTPEETKKAQNEFEFEDTYANDPLRDPRNLGCTLKPWCGEPRTDLLVENYYTPNALFYTRNHLPVPDLKAEDWRLEVLGTGVKPTTFTLDEIKNKFKKYDVVSTLQCAGNRREDMHNEKRAIFISPHWVIGAISNAKWSGARLRDVLAYCGMPVDDMALGKVPFTAEQAHVQFEAYDEDETGACARGRGGAPAAGLATLVVGCAGLTYGGSIPIDKAVDALGDCLVAYEMNGEPLPRDHGCAERGADGGTGVLTTARPGQVPRARAGPRARRHAPGEVAAQDHHLRQGVRQAVAPEELPRLRARYLLREGPLLLAGWAAA